ncbi:sulfur carrier protein ThiS [Moraxella sp. FZLJ2107]|uniref:sulfur carrier protein ThiS n=1 Tax=unclassified Moraxella TaxID=2685852 RepID=UPI0020C9067F|nr:MULTISPECIES: sulfur carrier protein ThiS [unclassified Moraxella]UTO06037.1 sulfur carrier protein ThiS [Moraxella sp. FZLJ2107]UTO22774.1 sulfur carrier protein ThiS [Moraxella sp. FZLJ2109]
MKNITLNGQAQNSSADTVLALLEEYSLTQGRFAVEIDGQLVPKSRLGTTTLADGMSIEVVQAVGGG